MATNEHEHDALPPLAHAVLQLFHHHLSEVQFADLDLGVLRAHARDLVEAQVEVERVEAALEHARSAANARSQALLAASQRALSYARIYAETDAELAARVAEIAEPRGQPAELSGMKKRGRPKKSDDTSLFSAVDAESEASTLM